MAFQRMRRALAGLASGVVLLALAACGSGTIESQFVPKRIVSFGDAFSDIGQNGKQYVVNDGSLNIFPQLTATDFGLTITPSSAGGLAYGRGNARIVAKPDAAGNSATLTVQEQIDAFLAANTLTATDLVIVQGGYSDIIYQVGQQNAGAQGSAQTLENVAQAARDLAAQVKRLVAAGGSHVVVAGVYNLGRSPWAIATSQQNILSQASARFNETLLISLIDYGNSVLYADMALQFDVMITSPSAFGYTNVTEAVCNSVDPGPGIGIGTGKVNSNLCTTSTLANTAYTTYMFADQVYPTQTMQRLLGDYVFNRVRNRW